MIKVETLHDKRKFMFDIQRDGWIPHQYEETKQYDTFYGFKPDWVVMDVGAWIGMWTIWAAPYVKKVYAMEPVPELTETLSRNVKLNRLTNVELSESALFSKTGIMEMDVTGKPAGSTLVDAWRHGSQWLYEGGRKAWVKTYRWDDWISRNDVEKVNLLKIDVEGAELEVFSGMNEVLPERMAVAVYHLDAPLPELVEILYEKGYVLEGFGYYDENAPNKGKPHSGFFRHKTIPYETPRRYRIRRYQLPTREEWNMGIPFYWESMGVKDD